MNKVERQEAIRTLVEREPVATQHELAEHLRRLGIRVNQATLSRDIRELGLVKVAGNGRGKPRYVQASALAPAPAVPASLGRTVKTCEPAGNLVVVRTLPGLASPLGLSIDRLAWGEVAGTVAGDDTLLVVVRDGHAPRRVADRLQKEVFA